MRHYRALALGLLIILALSACALDTAPVAPASPESGLPTSSPPTSAPLAATAASTERVTITFSLFESERAAFEPLIGPFEAANPDVHVQLVMLDPFFARGEPPDYERVVLSAADTTSFPMSPQAIASGWVHDLIPNPANHRTRGFSRTAHSHRLKPRVLGWPKCKHSAGFGMTPLMQADPTFDPADFFPGTLEAVSQGQELYLMPRSLRVPVLFYNQDLWAARGLPVPTADWTWSPQPRRMHSQLP